MSDLVTKLMQYESGAMDEFETLHFFARLINGGTIHSLQGHYERTATSFVDAGYITRVNGKWIVTEAGEAAASGEY